MFHLAPDAPAWIQATALPALVIHVSAGAIGIVSGATALFARKGATLHRAAGKVFLAAMLTMAAMATFLAAVVPGKGFNIIGGLFTFYLVATAWVTVRRREASVGGFEVAAMLAILAVAAVELFIGFAIMNRPGGTADGAPFQAAFIVAAVCALAAGLDLRVILRGGLSGVQRVARHLWRMCAALFVASGSFFIGQQKAMPAFMHGSPVLIVLGVAPLALMIFWLIRIRFGTAFKSGPRAPSRVSSRAHAARI